LRGYDFDRQKPIGNYIVDFYCMDLRLAIEIDGCSHAGKGSYDLHRQRELEGLGVTMLRFDDIDVKKDMEAVLELIREQVLKMEQR